MRNLLLQRWVPVGWGGLCSLVSQRSALPGRPFCTRYICISSSALVMIKSGLSVPTPSFSSETTWLGNERLCLNLNEIFCSAHRPKKKRRRKKKPNKLSWDGLNYFFPSIFWFSRHTEKSIIFIARHQSLLFIEILVIQSENRFPLLWHWL